MTISEIASVSGKGGLFRVISPTRAALILESLDESKKKMVATTHHRVSILNEISIYTTSEEGTVSLQDVLKKIYKDFGNDPGIDSNADASELKAFLKSVLPDYDEDRVYVSDIKKLVRWYGILLQFAPEVLSDAKEAESDAEKDKKPETDAGSKA